MAEPSLQFHDSPSCSPAPQTPQAPFIPPRRHSSLAFSSGTKPAAGPTVDDDVSDRPEMVQTPCPLQPNIGKKRTLGSPPARGTPSQLQRIFQAANGALHRDVFAASSPASSIESRMNLSQAPEPIDGRSWSEAREWRYSLAPQHLATVSIDVREPLPSPTLPDLFIRDNYHAVQEPEPVSSGFASPLTEQLDDGKAGTLDDLRADVLGTGPGHPSFEPARTCHSSDHRSETEIDQRLHHLKVDHGESDNDLMENLCTMRRIENQSPDGSIATSMQVSPHNSIYLPKSAEAAAESAKAKRGWLRGIFEGIDEDNESCNPSEETSDHLPPVNMICSDPIAHRISFATPCPEPSLHDGSPSLYRGSRPIYGIGVTLPEPDNLSMRIGPAVGGQRATATGSPMPSTRFRYGCSTAQSDRQSTQVPSAIRQREAQLASVNEHFQPGWYYAREGTQTYPGPSYSFSTAASKVLGLNQAPDSRMRDSYNTDTLTALPVPTTRYRKNGIRPEVPSRGLSRYYERPPPSIRTSASRSRPSARQTYAGRNEVAFRSSPPRGTAMDESRVVRRKRALDDSFMMAGDMYARIVAGSDMRLRESEEMMQLDDETKAAVRMSIFGTNPPGTLQSARQGTRELSPNVQLYRKGTREHEHLRKKRRPSYWDNDLKQVRESPAGRGGVRSPISVQESMRAEFEVASQRDTEMDFGDDDDLKEASAGPAKEE